MNIDRFQIRFLPDGEAKETARAYATAAHALGRLDALNELLEMMAVYKPRSSPELDELVRCLVEDAKRKALEAAPELNSTLARLRPDAAPLDASDVRPTEQ